MSVTDCYFPFDQLTEWVQTAAVRWPRWVRLSSLGNSFEGRPLWCLSVTDYESGHDQDRPALWVDGNLHAGELSGTNACLHLVQELIERNQELLGRVAFYVVPRVCPDGAELAMAGSPLLLRSSVRVYPYTDPIGAGIEPWDIDGNGKLLWMRRVDPRGPWKACSQDPRLLVRRDPADREGPFYQLLPEGRWRGDFDPDLIQPAPPRQALDLNRNYPYRWRPEGQQAGAGPFPASEPEVRHCVQFLMEHRNVCQAITFHTFSGVILRPSSTEPDESLLKPDLDNYKFFGERGSEWTGYPLLSVFHDFRYTPKDVITGTFDDWVYESLGAYAWTVEIWSVLRKAGITQGLDRDCKRGEHRFIAWFADHPIEEEIQLLEFCQQQLDGHGFEEWQPFQHPTLGAVEIGGWDMLYLFRNPPLPFLRQELEPLTRWVIWLAQASPRLEVVQTRLDSLGNDLYRLELVVDNTGWLPTYGSHKALEGKVVRGVRVLLEWPGELLEGKREQQLGQLEGISQRTVSPMWSKGDAADYRLKVSWVVRSLQPTPISWQVLHERAGNVRGSLICG
jgi:murein tripeptide amidase MpaA